MPAAGRSAFTGAEINQIRARLRELRRADRTRQKTIRAGLRSMGFRITDYTHDQQGFTVADCDALVKRGVITIIDDDPTASTDSTAKPTIVDHPATASRPPRTSVSPTPQVQPASNDPAVELDDLVAAALEALRQNRYRLDRAAEYVPDRPGLYAIYGDPSTWAQLGLGEPPGARPLYIGKAEDSLVSRDLRTHFGDGRTGQSTVRRSLAALLRGSLGLRAIPRNPAKPGYFSSYGLSPAHDTDLTAWMREYLQLAVWIKPDGGHLESVERRVLSALIPPLNLKDVTTPWQPQVKAARATMAAEARRWSAKRQDADATSSPR
jgi:hypothetical protein